MLPHVCTHSFRNGRLLEAFEAPLQQLCLHESEVMVQTQTSEMLPNKFMPQAQS